MLSRKIFRSIFPENSTRNILFQKSIFNCIKYFHITILEIPSVNPKVGRKYCLVFFFWLIAKKGEKQQQKMKASLEHVETEFQLGWPHDPSVCLTFNVLWAWIDWPFDRKINPKKSYILHKYLLAFFDHISFFINRSANCDKKCKAIIFYKSHFWKPT